MHDVVIIGGGPSGLAAAIYAARARLSTLLIEKLFPGGQTIITALIENYPGFATGISGPELAAQMREQAERFGAETMLAEVESADLTGDIKRIVTNEGPVEGWTAIIATGASPRKLGIPGEQEFLGRGVSYCATCDGALFEGKKLAVIGGGDTAVEDSVFLAKFSPDVTIIHRRNQFRAQKIIQERAMSHPAIKVMWDTTVAEIQGNRSVDSLLLRNVQTDKLSELDVDGVFVLIGQEPDTSFCKGQADCDPSGYVKTDESMQTGVPGVYAVGDVRCKPLRQVVTACADGAIAATVAEKYLEAKRAKN